MNERMNEEMHGALGMSQCNQVPYPYSRLPPFIPYRWGLSGSNRLHYCYHRYREKTGRKRPISKGVIGFRLSRVFRQVLSTYSSSRLHSSYHSSFPSSLFSLRLPPLRRRPPILHLPLPAQCVFAVLPRGWLVVGEFSFLIFFSLPPSLPLLD
ncbi:hypothetical protein ASPFODRAFT_698651 [Aspergillus luchuensis CBS 106.47]|uniref:Uncharacterized protein n=1 Tax=Aspergillus luchuensis (strain CBS 106.47) TaxID=1137211 RepID=A0A1M3TBG9_ASPLC|nr:hypothetical protein ASPFODRAFT_698651 [Aspergillus luchuensis CBS 106.47]